MDIPPNCIQCVHHRVLPDPDPTDWFCDDDVKVECVAAKDKLITSACRPYNTERECAPPPDWCPIRIMTRLGYHGGSCDASRKEREMSTVQGESVDVVTISFNITAKQAKEKAFEMRRLRDKEYRDSLVRFLEKVKQDVEAVIVKAIEEGSTDALYIMVQPSQIPFDTRILSDAHSRLMSALDDAGFSCKHEVVNALRQYKIMW